MTDNVSCIVKYSFDYLLTLLTMYYIVYLYTIFIFVIFYEKPFS